MRYVFGDSSGPFPLQYQFLEAFERFVSHAARGVALDAEIRGLQQQLKNTAAAREKALGQLESVHEATLRALATHAGESAGQPAVEYVQKMSAHSAVAVADIRKAAAMAADVDATSAKAEVEKRRLEMRKALEAILLAIRLPSDQVAISMRHRDGKNEMSAAFAHADGIQTAFMLGLSRAPAWQEPRKVGDFAKDMDLPVGVKRSWLKRGVSHEMAHIDDWIISAFDLDDDAADITFRRKVVEPDCLRLQIRRQGDVLSADVHYPNDPEAENVPTEIDGMAIGHLERLWQQLRAGCSEALLAKERLLHALVGGKDVIDEGQFVPLVRAIVKLVTPTVLEIAKHSPNPEELSLKAENGPESGGRREEIYVRKAVLWEKIEPLGPEEKSIFAALPLAPPRKKSSSEDEEAWTEVDALR
jgi:hypothetical protein